MNTVSFHNVPTTDVEARFHRLGRDMAEERDTIRTLSAQLQAAQKRFEAAEAAQRHVGAVLSWRTRTGAQQGDAISDLIALYERLEQPHRLIRLTQRPADGEKPETAVILIRTRQGQRIRITYHGYFIKVADLPDNATIPLGAALDAPMNHAILNASWPGLGGSQTWMVRASRQKPVTYVEVAGDLVSIEILEAKD